jgi:hypothetical protein
MKKKSLHTKLTLRKELISNFEMAKLMGGVRTDICSGTQDTCINCDTPTKKWPCPSPTRGDWTCDCPQQ